MNCSIAHIGTNQINYPQSIYTQHYECCVAYKSNDTGGNSGEISLLNFHSHEIDCTGCDLTKYYVLYTHLAEAID